MLLFLRDADVVDEWLRAQQQATASNSQADIDLETCEKEIHDLEKRQGITFKNQFTFFVFRINEFNLRYFQ